ncbi:DUF998 domain-containing protein [Streptomyces flaveus]|uniref:DUF998 domain-containing protein n=1 Tax=Streptomyces flaveus TaxID=66370 RepID=A0A917RQ75_9ACTN|nr:DUF998 domain-containing protein [Streptomyces flaveus]GGL18164.1 hypothetical protein GCM10010094_93920 [Streptomyces flaveus]
MSQTNTVKAAAQAAAPVRAPAVRARKSLLACGVIAGPFYVLVSLTQAWMREGFDLTRHAWSLLANGSLGWIQMTNLILTGVLVIAGAAGLRSVLPPGAPSITGRGSTWAPRLLVAYGVSMVGAGIFRADPAQGFPPGTPDTGTSTSWHGALHFVLAGVGFLCLVAACFVLAHRFVAAGLQGWARFSRSTAVVFLAGFLALAASGGRVWVNLTFTAAIVLAWAWMSMALMHFHGRAARTRAA